MPVGKILHASFRLRGGEPDGFYQWGWCWTGQWLAVGGRKLEHGNGNSIRPASMLEMLLNLYVYVARNKYVLYTRTGPKVHVRTTVAGPI